MGERSIASLCINSQYLYTLLLLLLLLLWVSDGESEQKIYADFMRIDLCFTYIVGDSQFFYSGGLKEREKSFQVDTDGGPMR